MSHFKKNLERMDFVENGSLLLITDLEDKKVDLDIAEVFALEKAKEFRATAVYFRHFSDNRTPIPQIYIYDNTGNALDNRKIAEIHRDLWSYCKIPMFIVVEKTDVKIFDARQPVKILDARRITGLFANEILTNPIETNPIDTLKISSEAIKLYSRKLFDSGVFWESEKAQDRFLESTSAYNDLIVNLKKVRKDFIKKTTLPEKTANRLLVSSILIKYLEERGNENERLFAHDFFQKLDAENFCGVLRQKGKIIKLFAELSRHFNGEIFKWTEQESKDIEKEDLSELAFFLDGESNLESRQLFFDWRKYSFNHLPVELISSVYEELLNERDDAVYTPEFLVNTLIDESMPQSEYKRKNVKTIDISCGSGIFLVSAFKRLVQRHRYAEFEKTQQLPHLTSDQLLQIIKDNIFGVDIEEDAVRLTVFSLCLALCDELDPIEIWNDLQFDNTFETNFKDRNFFDYLKSDKEKLGTFDLVIGNVPFEELGKKPDVYEEILNLNEVIKANSKKRIYPKKQIALMFLDQSPYLLKENGLLCLIMPAAPLLYNNSAEFRKYFFTKFQVKQILDFTGLVEVLFGTAKVPTSAIFIQKQTYDKEKPITHITVRRTKSVEEKIFFEIDKYDFHYVSSYDALHNKHIWKCNLLGGGRIKNLIDRLSDIDSVETFIKAKDWIYGVGYEVGSPSKQVTPAPYITLKSTIPTRAFSENGIDSNQITIETAEKFHRISDERLFTPPHLLIKKMIGVSKIPNYFSDKYLTFKDSIIGIADPKNKKEELLKFSNKFEQNKTIYKFYIAATSNEYLVGRATTILNQDIMNLPYSEDKDEMKLSYVEQIICDDVLDYQVEMLSKGSAAEVNWKKATKTDLQKFGEVFNKMLNSVYGKSGKYFYLKKIYDWGEFFVTEFNYGVNTGDLEFVKRDEQSEDIKSLIETKFTSSMFLNKTVRLNERNKVSFFKPKTLRYWLRSIALKDADDVFSDLVKVEVADK